MNKILKLFATSLLLLIVFFLFSSEKIFAGCEDPAICDAAPGTCSTTCNGGQPCQINNNGWLEQEVCTEGGCDCRDSNNFFLGACTVDGSLCGGTGSDPYGPGGDYGTCQCDTESCTTEFIFTCTETTWATCCAPGTPAPSGSPVAEYCGNGTCNGGAGEDCSTCESDCGSCAPAPVCGDASCNGGENCSTCAADCGNCPVTESCGNGVCGASESCSTCPGDCGSCLTCGDASCNNGETCSTCAADCGACTASCGDGQCTGFETCESCAADCGTCIYLGNQPWWQAGNGHVYAGNSAGVVVQASIFESAGCLTPSCYAQLLFPDSTTLAVSEGLAITGGGTISVNGFLNTDDTSVVGSSPSRFRENYDFFYRNSGLGLSPTSDFTGQENDILEPVLAKEAYYHQGDVTLQSAWSVTSGESYVVFIDGNLTISDPSNVNQITTVEEGGFLAFIVSGTITISEDLGNETITDTTSNLEGMFIADGIITIESRGTAGGGDDRFVGEGSFVSWTRVAMDRNYDDGAGRDSENQDKPVETFIFRPDLVRNTPDILTRPHSIWQETN